MTQKVIEAFWYGQLAPIGPYLLQIVTNKLWMKYKTNQLKVLEREQNLTETGGDWTTGRRERHGMSFLIYSF